MSAIGIALIYLNVLTRMFLYDFSDLIIYLIIAFCLIGVAGVLFILYPAKFSNKSREHEKELIRETLAKNNRTEYQRIKTEMKNVIPSCSGRNPFSSTLFSFTTTVNNFRR